MGYLNGQAIVFGKLLEYIHVGGRQKEDRKGCLLLTDAETGRTEG